VSVGTLGPNGTFAIGSVTPGDYLIIARGVAAASNAYTTWATANVTVGDDDVRNVMLTLQAGLTVAGAIASSDGSLVPDTSKIKVGLDAANEDDLAVSVAPVVVDANGQFRFTGILPGRYRLSISGVPGGWVAAGASLDGHDSLDRVVDIAGSTTPRVTVTLSPDAADLSGAFVDVQNHATSDYHVIVFDKDRQHWVANSTRVATARPDTSGHYAIGNLPAGHYWLAALTDVEPGEWNDATFLASLVPSAIAIDLSSGEHKVQNIKLAGR
jgi:hypothetical protein